MRIGFDLRPAVKKNSRRRGIGKYTYELIKHLLELNREHEYVLYSFWEGAPASGGRPYSSEHGHFPELSGAHEKRNLPHLTKPSRLNWLSDLLLLPRRIRADRLDIFHATEMTSIPRVRGSKPQIWANVHDLIPFIFWEETVKRIPPDFAYALRLSLSRMKAADLIITDSEHSKRDICERLGMDPSKVHVIYLACDDNLGPRDRDRASAELNRRFEISDPFLLYVGGSDYRKNLQRLVKAFAAIRQKGYTGKLVMAGETFLWDIREIREIRGQIHQESLAPFIVFPGYIPDQDLPLFYSACDFFIFPSLYEGFGLPVLEALKCGAPVLTSNTSSIPEIAADAAVYFDPQDEKNIVSSFFEVFGDAKKIEQLRQRGFDRAAGFSWRKAAEEIHRLYRDL